MKTITYEEKLTLVSIECCNCGVVFAMPEKLQERLINNHNTFYCPNGHGMNYNGKSKETKLKEELEREKMEREEEVQKWQNKYFDEMNARSKAEKKLKRVEKGICPCCNRSFANLKSHMETKHPEVAAKSKQNPIHSKINNKKS